MKSKSKLERVLIGTSAIAMAVSSAIAAAQENAQAQESADKPTTAQTAESEGQTIVVTGIRASLENAAEIKRKADTFVDSVTASDVSSLPDLSVAEALQRVPGVTVTRFPYGGASPDFPSPEGRGNLIRGLGFVRSEFNGRDAFSANGGRALDWSSIPPDLVGAVDVYKNQSADLIEGGIGGTINLRTLEPFDRAGHILSIAGDATYTDVRDEWAPTYDLVAGSRWETSDAGEFGVLASFSSSKLYSMINGWQQGAPTPRLNPGVDEQPRDSARFVGVPASQIGAYIPGFQLRTNEVDRDRTSYYLATQWQNEGMRATLKYTRVENDIDSLEHTTEWFPDHDGSSRVQMFGVSMDSNWSSTGVAACGSPGGGDCERMVPIGGGLMTAGTVSDTGESWWGAFGTAVGTLGIGKHEMSTTEDISLNFKWDATEKLFFEFDAQLTEADADFVEVWGGGNFFANVYTEPDLESPLVRFTIDPRTNINRANTRAGGTGTLGNPTGTTDPIDANWQFAADAFKEGTGELKAGRIDSRYEFGEDNWFKAVRFGVRYSEREQINKEIGLNWGAIAPAWSGAGGGVNGGAGVFSQFSTPAHEYIDFSDFFRGGTVKGDNVSFPYIRRDLLMDYVAMRNYILNEPLLRTNHPWNPRGTMEGKGDYRPQEISDITEETSNAYFRFDFGTELGSSGRSIDGNVGVRYVRTQLDTSGSLYYLPFAADNQNPGTQPRTPDAELHDDPRDFLPETAAFLEQQPSAIVVARTDEHWLPSLNVKFNLNEDMLLRFGASKAVARPNVQDLRASQRYEANVTRVNYPTITDPNDPLYQVDRGLQDVRLDRIKLTQGNPLLEPTTAVNLDLSFEWYFKGGFASVAGFHKDLENIITTGDQITGQMTLDGRSVEAIYNGQVNLTSANLYGVELAYQQFYDQLPGWMSHLGLQANYTNIQASGDPPGKGVDADGNGTPDDTTTLFRFDVSDLMGQSEHIANLVAIYQDRSAEVRLAYNWRSDYLTSYRDWVTGNPIYVAGGGFLDASFRYDFNEHLQVSASVANVLDQKEKAFMLLNEQGETAPRFAFLNDRRIVLGVRYQF